MCACSAIACPCLDLVFLQGEIQAYWNVTRCALFGWRCCWYVRLLCKSHGPLCLPPRLVPNKEAKVAAFLAVVAMHTGFCPDDSVRSLLRTKGGCASPVCPVRFASWFLL